MQTAHDPDAIEFIVYVDDDDNSYDGMGLKNMTFIKGQQLSIAEAWNKCWENASSEFYGLFGDDVVFHDKDWDIAVLERFKDSPDNIGFVYGYDGSPYNDTYGTHGFIHKNWTDTIGYFVPPYFKANYVDLWLNDVAKAIGRHFYIPYYFEHQHQGMGKAYDDEIYQLGRERDKGMAELYAQLAPERQKDIDKLKEYMESYGE